MQARIDEELMMEYKNTRDPEALVELFHRYRRPVYRYLARRCGNPSRAEDLAQEVFCALIANASRYQPSGSFRAYLYRIAQNLSAKEWRTYRRRVQLASEPASNPGQEQSVEARSAAAAVQHALSSLEPEQREPILLREYQGLSYAEIGEVLGIPEGTVKSRIARGKMALRKMLLAEAGA
jgi:RNA polymerase sigma-70 factor (ECF subfamily)